MRRTFGLDVLACPRCGGRLRLLALIEQASVVQRILRHLSVPTEVIRGAARERRPDDPSQSRINPETLPNSIPPGDCVESGEEGRRRGCQPSQRIAQEAREVGHSSPPQWNGGHTLRRCLTLRMGARVSLHATVWRVRSQVSQFVQCGIPLRECCPMSGRKVAATA